MAIALRPQICDVTSPYVYSHPVTTKTACLVPEHSTVNFVQISWPTSGMHVHWAGHRDLRAAVTSSIVVQLTSSEAVLVRMAVERSARSSEVSGSSRSSSGPGARVLASPLNASMTSRTQRFIAKIARTQLMSPFVVASASAE